MMDWPNLIAQMPDDDGRGWYNLLILLVVIVLPVLNAIKDKFVERSEKKRAQRDTEEASPPSGAPGIPMAKPVQAQKAEGWFVKLPGVPGAEPAVMRGAPPQPVVKKRVPSPAPSPQPTAEAKPPLPRPASRVPVVPAEPKPAAPRPAPPAAEAKPPGPVPAESDRAELVRKSLVGVHAADPRVDVATATPHVDVHAADPRVDVREVDPHAPVWRGEPVAEEAVARPDETGQALPAEPALLGRALTRAQMRRAVALSEILRLPVGLRGPGGFVGPDRP
jgi:hypothetical protein